jgi:hypothetical protein
MPDLLNPEFKEELALNKQLLEVLSKKITQLQKLEKASR